MVFRLGRLVTKAITGFELLLNYFAVLLLAVMMFLGTTDVILRKFFNRPITGALEVSRLLMAAAIFLIIGYVQAQKSNIRLELILRRYSPPFRFGAELFGYLLTLLLFVLIAWQSFALAWKDIGYGRLIENIYVPIYPFEFLLTFGAVLVCLECLIQIVALFTRQEWKRDS